MGEESKDGEFLIEDVRHMVDDPKFRIKPYQQMISAITGGLVTSLFMTPLDVVKTRMQTQQKVLLSDKCFLYCNGLMDHLCPCEYNPIAATQPVKQTVKITGVYDGLVKISRSEGMASLWSGLSPTLVSALPATVMYFVAYEQFKIHLKDFHIKYFAKEDNLTHSTLPLYIPLLSGTSARVLAVTVVSPLEMMRTKMQSQKLSYLEIYESLKQVVNTDGLRGLYKGLPPTLYRDIPFSAIYWCSYEYMKALISNEEPTFGVTFLAGAIAGSTAAFFTTPFDVVKTHQQIEFGEKVLYTDNPAKNIPNGKSVLQSISDIYRVNGVRGLFAGLGPRIIKVAPACAIMISSFEFGKSFFYKHNVRMYMEQNSL